jgi:hypothetical protein
MPIVTPCFSQKNKTLGTIYLNIKSCVMHSCHHKLSFGLMSVVSFYFAVRNHSKFKSHLNSNALRILKGFEKNRSLFLFLCWTWARISLEAQSARSFSPSLTPHRAQQGPKATILVPQLPCWVLVAANPDLTRP